MTAKGSRMAKSKISKVKVVTPDIAERTVQSAVESNETKRTVHSNPDAAKCTAQSVRRSNGTKSTVQSIDELAEATADAAKCTAHSGGGEDPRHFGTGERRYLVTNASQRTSASSGVANPNPKNKSGKSLNPKTG